jgi:hypothetical protein
MSSMIRRGFLVFVRAWFSDILIPGKEKHLVQSLIPRSGYAYNSTFEILGIWRMLMRVRLTVQYIIIPYYELQGVHST